MRSHEVLLALLPLSFAAPNVHRHDEDVKRGLLAGRSCLLECQTNIVHGEFNLSTGSRPRSYQEYCVFAEKLSECFEKCPKGPASPLMKQYADINKLICVQDLDAEKFEEFLVAQNLLAEQWFGQTISSCLKDPRSFNSSQRFEKCSLFLDCFFGEALTAAKGGYDDLVVASIVVPSKLEYALEIGGGVWTEDVVDECSSLFAPFDVDHVNSRFLPASACLLICQNDVSVKYRDTLESEQLQKAQYCAYSGELNDCLGKCQESPITPVIKQSADFNARICGPDFSEEQLKAFLSAQKELILAWYSHAGSCAANAPLAGRDWADLFENCSVYLDCFFGEAFGAVKDDFDELVAAAASSYFKLQYARLVGRGKWTKGVVDECPAVFMPFEARNTSALAKNKL